MLSLSIATAASGSAFSDVMQRFFRQEKEDLAKVSKLG
jgi:hypothetical protein